MGRFRLDLDYRLDIIGMALGIFGAIVAISYIPALIQ